MWRGLVWGATQAGYSWGIVRRLASAIPRSKHVRMGPLSFRLPVEWSEFVDSAEGDVFAASRPHEQILDGDTNWYSTISEIRVRRPGARRLAHKAPMLEIEHEVQTRFGPLVLVLRIANGVGARKRAEAMKVLKQVRVTNAGPMAWAPTLPKTSLQRNS